MAILLIEENQDIRELIEVLLLECRLSVRSVGSCDEALRELRERTFSALICSLGMLDRPSSRALKESVDRAGIPKKIGITGHLPARAKQMAAFKCFHEVYYKPFDINSIMRSLAEIREKAI